MYSYDNCLTLVPPGDPIATWDGIGQARTLETPSGTFNLNYGPDGDLVENTGTDGGRYLGHWIKLSETSSDWHARILVNDSVIAVVSSINNTVTTHYLIQDALGSTAAVTDETGTTTTRIAYDAWGNLVQPDDGTTKVDPTTISNLTTVGYTGGELIAEANLVQMGARLYDPASGVFLNPDPTVAAPFDARDWNQYAYVYDNPMNNTDPTGYEPESINLGTVNVSGLSFDPWSQGAMDCTEFAEQSNPACHDAIYGLPPNYANDDVFLALAARADAMARAKAANTQHAQAKCKAGLKIAGQNQAAVQRADAAWAMLTSAASANGIDPALLAAIGVRETGFRDVLQHGFGTGNNWGAGIFQIDVRQNPDVTVSEAMNPGWAANYAASMLASNNAILASRFQNFTPDQLLQATAASYNLGTDPHFGITGNPATIDIGSASNNYGNNVVGIMSCFQ